MTKSDLMKHRLRIEYRNRIVSLARAIQGSVLKYEVGPLHHVWHDLVLRSNRGEEIARVCTTGSFILNHWFCDRDGFETKGLPF